jgi:hypothetical protein
MANKRPLVWVGGRLKELPTADTLYSAGTSLFAGTATFTVAPVFTDAAGSRTALGLGSGNSPTFQNMFATVSISTPYALLTPGAAPGALTEGQIWTQSDGDKLKAYLGSATRDVLTGTPGALSPTSTNAHDGATHTHAVDLLDATARLSSAAITAYPVVGPLVGQADTASGDFVAGTLFTAYSSTARAWQLHGQAAGGTQTPVLKYRSTHTSGGGGGWTSLYTLALLEAANTWPVAQTFGGSPNTASANSIVVAPTLQSGVTTGYSGVATNFASAAGAYTTPSIHQFLAQDWTPGAGHTITNHYGFRTGNLTAGASNYSFHGGITSTAAGQWNCYMAGAAPNYFNGEVRIGSTTDYGGYQLQVTGVSYLDAVGGSTIPVIGAAVGAIFARATSDGAGSRIAIIGGRAGTTGINIGDQDDEDVAALLYDHATETWSIRINGASAYTLTATALTLPATPAAGTNNTVAATTAYAMSAAPNASYRNILDCSGSHTAARAAGTYMLPQGQPIAVVGTGTLYPMNTIYLDPADYPTVNGLAAKLRIRAQVFCNDVAPTGNYTFGLYPVTRPATSGGAGLVIYTVGTVIAGSTAAVNTPAADSSNNVVGADFAIPAAGHYVLGVVTTAAVAASAHVHISAQLQMRNN